MLQDKSMVCRDCGEEFIFTVGEQEFYQTKGFANEPSRCPQCRKVRKQSQSTRSGSGGGGGGGYGERAPRSMYQATCSQCGGVAEVPFRPSGNKPVYCKDCYQPRERW